MGRKRRLDKKHVDSQVSPATPDAEESCEVEDCIIPLELILAQQGSDKEYLRLRKIRGQLPLSFYSHFRDLRILNLRNCDIRSLAPQITQLRNLRHIDISGNAHIKVPAHLSRCNLTRLVYSPSLADQKENDKIPYSTVLNASYCGDKTVHKISRLSRLAAQVIIETCDLVELEEVRSLVPGHLKDILTPAVCAECGSIGRRIVATRIRKAVVAFNTVPLHYDLCSSTCLARIQEVWKLEELLNNEKRALRLQKFGRLTEMHARDVMSYAYA